MLLRRPRRPPSKHHVVRNVKEIKQVGENETRLSDKRKFEEASGSVTSADQVSIRTGKNIYKDEGDSHPMRAESMIGKDGGTLDIQNTGVSLEIPPGALQSGYFIQMSIIPHHYLDETELSFASNSSVVVELLPNNVKLLKPATLTLPHCLVLKGKCEWKAKGYSSHHKEGTQPQWEEEINTQCDVTYENCAMRLHNFSWKKVQFGDDIVEAKRIMLFAAKRPSIKNEIFLDIGYYWDLPSCREFLSLNHAVLLHQIPALFYRKGKLPLTVLFEKVVPTSWTYNEENNEKIIKFKKVAIMKGNFCTFNVKKRVSDGTDESACFFKAGQGSDLVDLMFSLNECSSSNTEAIIPATRMDTAGDTQEELPSASLQTDDSAVSEDSLLDLSEHIGEVWKFVGRSLGVTEEKLCDIEQKVDASLKEKTYQMLRVWHMKMASAANFDVLGKALSEAGRVDLQQYLLKKYQPT